LQLDQLGESGLISYLCRRFNRTICQLGLNKSIPIGIGDDAFVVQLSANRSRKGILRDKYLVLSSDTLAEDVHFQTKWVTFEQLGWKAGAVVLSDFAAMGAVTPRYLLANVGLPSTFPFVQVKRFYSGLEKISQRWGIIIAGGDTVRAEKIFFTVFLVGETKKNDFVSRSGAKIGDLIFSTGPLGEAAAGLSLLKKGYTVQDRRYKELIRKHLLPNPRLNEGKILAQKKLATSMIDCSDGLEKSVRLIAETNDVGAEIYLENLPLTTRLKNCLEIVKDIRAFWHLALFGGEDYELVFTTSPLNYQKIMQLIPTAFWLGKICKKKGVNFLYQGKPVTLQGKSYDAFQG